MGGKVRAVSDLCEIWDDGKLDWVVEGGVRKVRCRLVARLPMLQPAEVIVAATATVDGRVAVLATPRAASPGQYHSASVYAHDGDLTWWPIELTGPAVGHSVLDLLPGGEILVVGSRSQRFRTAGICRAISLESRICCADSAMSLTTGAYRQLGVALAGAPASWSRTCT